MKADRGESSPYAAMLADTEEGTVRDQLRLQLQLLPSAHAYVSATL